MRKVLGKIDSAGFGFYPDRPFLFGLQLCFSMSSSGVDDGGRYTVNISPECRWEKQERTDAIEEYIVERVEKILKDAKVNFVSELIGKPVEIELEGSCFKDFRILTEVL